MANISWWEILLVVLVILLLFGPKRLPQIGRSLGRGMREFKDTVTDQTKGLKEAVVDTPKEFKGGLNPFKSSETIEDAEVVETPAPPTPPAAAPPPEPVAAAPSNGAPETPSKPES